MMTTSNVSNKERLREIIRQEIVPGLEALTGSLTEECIEHITSHSRLKQVTKNQFIQSSGSYEDGHLSYLYRGIAHSFYYHQETNKTFVTRLWKKDEIIFDTNSFVKSEDRLESIQMLEDGELIAINYYHLKSLLNKFPELFALFPYLQIDREKHSKYYQHLLKLTAEERVSLFIQHNPTLISRINKDAIALYLGMSRCRFSTALHKNI
ncbi:Crp/Fnr family transcriptional regulator [Pedobacter hiemivivus]|uniref:Crp/Fnr family transcriptional regulator n=1 Tax=Pedobacter hiemivivus TaxID=2530454 RepID=A0A4U1GH63_9SPHI|nr:Crp/Fnr family transcriptional regulator [Pedobacter hiemivivus]TCC99559.1 Crp/Fnr family transcriptional regulator [Pedobacter hiemivivus]TKC62509.1 Crp/Fnr family transcriptional regulator [Pedobacter hiemivivus]